MNVEMLTVGLAASNCYLVWNDDREALVIDPGDQATDILNRIKALDLRVVAYPLTHGHVDHVSALAEVHRKYPAPISLHAEDASWAFSERNQLPPWYDVPATPDAIERELTEGQEWIDAGFRYEVIHTPGHTPGGVCFRFPDHNVLVSGDTLFAGSIGRTDLPGGDMTTLQGSLRRLLELPDDLRVLPGHGPETTIGQERRTNPFLQSL